MQREDRKRICIYCDSWTQGGIETFLAETLLHIDTRDFCFFLVCAEKIGSKFDTRLEEKGFPIFPFLSTQGASALKKTLKTAIPLAKFCKEKGIDVAHLNVFHGVSLIQALMLKLYGIKRVIVHCHGAGLRESKLKRLKLLGHWLCKRFFFWTVDERWAASRQAARFLFDDKPSRIIPNGIDVQRFRFDPQKRYELREKLQVNDQLLFGCIGRLDSQKNQQFLITLLAKYKKTGYNAKLLLIGDGDERSTLEERTKKLGLCTDVIFGGNSNCVNEWMCAMDALLIPSTSEGFGITAVEGQAAGLPVICSTGVPQEVELTYAVKFLPLSEPERWLDTMKNIPALDRIELNNAIKNSDYDIRKSTEIVHIEYMRLIKARQ